MKRNLAFVLGGGGSRGALQVGALRALLEADILPDMLVGTSIGAVNATFLALHGLNLEGIAGLEQAWYDAAEVSLLPANYLWLTVRTLFNRSTGNVYHRMRDFFIAHGLPPELRFKDIEQVQLFVVATDLNAACVVLRGQDRQDFVLEAVLASTALPPWISPLEKDGQLLVDGGAVSTLPIEPALSQGATEIIALDLYDERVITQAGQGFGPFVGKLLYTVERRQAELELALAAARRVPVRHVSLRGKEPVFLWDFQKTEHLIDLGYETMSRELANWQAERRPWWRAWLAGRQEQRQQANLRRSAAGE